MITSTWKPLEADVREFLTEFERRGIESDSDSGDQFSEQFLTTDPQQVFVLSRDALVASLPHRRRMFAQAGVGSARCVATSQLDLDDQHVLVTSDWDAERAGKDPIRLESPFLLRRTQEGLRILAYINHRDVVAVLASL